MKRYIKVQKTILPTDKPLSLTEYNTTLEDGYYIASTRHAQHNQYLGRSASLTEAKQMARSQGWWIDGEPVAFVLTVTPNGMYKAFAMRYLDTLTLKALARTDWNQLRLDDKHTDGIISKGTHEKGNILINL